MIVYVALCLQLSFSYFFEPIFQSPDKSIITLTPHLKRLLVINSIHREKEGKHIKKTCRFMSDVGSPKVLVDITADLFSNNLTML